MSFLKTKAVFSKIVKFQLFGLLLIALSCSFNLIQAQTVQPNTVLINDILNFNLTNTGAGSALRTIGNVNIFDNHHKVPLMYAVESTMQSSSGNALSFVTLLLNPDNPGTGVADPTVVDTSPGSEQKTVLMHAVSSLNEGVDSINGGINGTGQPVLMEIIQTLLTQLNSSGTGLLIDVNAKDTHGKTALDYAASSPNFLAPKIVMTLLLTPGIQIPSGFQLTTVQKNTLQLWQDLITPSANLVIAPNAINPNFDLTTVLADINQSGGIDLNAQDNTGTTIIMYIAQALQALNTAVTAPLTAAQQTQVDNLTSVLNAMTTAPNFVLDIDFNLINLYQPAGLNSNVSFKSIAKKPFSYHTGRTAGGTASQTVSRVAGFYNTGNSSTTAFDASVNALNTATENQTTAITTLFINLNNGTFSTAGTPPQAVLTSANVNYRDPNSNHWTPLIYAVQGSLANLNTVLNQTNVDLDAQDDNGKTALMYAAQSTSNALGNIQVLISYATTNNVSLNINIQDANGWTALMYALMQPGQSDSVIKVLLTIPGLDLNIADINNLTALAYAYKSSQSTDIINAITNALNSQLLTAINNGDLATVNRIIATLQACSACACNGCPTIATIDLLDSKNKNMTPLMHAVLSLNGTIDQAARPTPSPVVIEIINALLSAGANINATDTAGMTPLMYATQSQNSTIDTTVTPNQPLVATVINTLVQNGANLAAVDNNQHNAVYYAQQSTTSNKTAILQTLLTLVNTQLIQDLQSAAATLATIQNDIAAGADINYIDTTNNDMTPLMYAAQSQNGAIDTTVTPNQPVIVEIINYLLNNPALTATGNAFAQDSNGNTAYYYATQSSNPNQAAIFAALSVATTPQLFSDLQNPQCTVGNLGEDLNAGASLTAVDSKNHTPLYYAQQLPSKNSDKPAILQTIITTVTNQLFSDLQNSTTPPTLAIIQADIAAGANVIAPDSNNHTAFYYAQQLPTSNTAKIAIINAIITAATNQLFSDLQNNTTPPTLAIIQADIAAGANVIAPDSKNNTALYYAQQLPNTNTSKAAIVTALQQAATNSAITQLFNDLQNNSVTLAKIQADLASSFGVNITAVVDANNHTALYYAQQLPNTNTAKSAIVQAVATAQLFNDLQNSTTPPTLAKIQADITAGANVIKPDSKNNAALYYAQQLPSSNTDKSAIIQAIVTAATAQLFSDLQNSTTPPTLAMIQADITAGANVNQIDSQNKTPLMYAQLLPSTNTAKATIIQLIQTTAAGSVTNQLFSDLQNSAVTLATIQADIVAGANVNAVDKTNNNLTPLMYAIQSQNSTIDTTVTPNVPVVIEIIQTLINAMQKSGVQNNSIYAQDGNKHTALYYVQQLTGNSNQAAIETIIATAQLFYDLQNPAVTIATIQADITASANVVAQDVNQKTTLDYANLLPATNTDKTAIIAALQAAATPQLLLDLQNPNSTLADIQADIAAGANINYIDTTNNDMTPLMYAAQSQNSLIDTTVKPSQPVIVEILNYILNHPTLTTAGNVFAQDKNGNAAYYYASNSGNANQAAITAIFTAATTPQLLTDLQNNTVTLAMIQKDIAAGANVNAVDNTGMTPLMHIAQSQNNVIDSKISPAVPVVLEIINALINANANNAALDHNGHTALYYAKNNWGNSIIFQTAPYKAQIITALTPSDTVSLGTKQAVTPVKSQTTVAPTIPTVPAQVSPKPVLRAIPTEPVVSDKSTAAQQKPKSKIKTIKRATTVK